uniref:Putative group i salivary lipocalin n=1 Tax=Rhipicephalus pulchellus TaxID=72859 RepID=L7LT48_RHIPC
MHKELLLAIFFLFSTDKLLLICTSPPRSMIYDIKHFVNTSLQIWTYRTTNPKDIRCKVDVMSSINQHYIMFTRSMILHKRREKVHLRGEFFKLLPDRMTIYPPAFEEILLYQVPSSSCAVIKVRMRYPGVLIYYDLRVKESAIGVYPGQECKAKFLEVAPHSTVIYSPNCTRKHKWYDALLNVRRN